jgi:hypothetical protein
MRCCSMSRSRGSIRRPGPSDVLEHPNSLDVAQFLGFTGQIREADGSLRCVRPTNVTLDAAGEFHGTVTGVVPEEDGVLCEIALPSGQVQVRSVYPGPRLGARVSVQIDGGVRFAAEHTSGAVRP